MFLLRCFRAKKVKGATLLSTVPHFYFSFNLEQKYHTSLVIIITIIRLVPLFLPFFSISLLLVGSLVSGNKSVESTQAVSASPGLTGITIDKSVEFSYEELAQATNDFSKANKIGEGGFGAVYYANLRGEEAAIKKMDMQASKEFLAELRVLTHVHHPNLAGSHFLGLLECKLRLTQPELAGFGLTKLSEVGSASLPTRLIGTFGYMPPEYAQYGDVSPKIDVYAFGVMLYELISAKEAIVKANDSIAESKGLVALFEDALSEPDPKEELCKLIDPRLGDDYPLDSVFKMAQLAKACTQESPQPRPSMRSTVVMSLSSSKDSLEDRDIGSLGENEALVNLMSGR